MKKIEERKDRSKNRHEYYDDIIDGRLPSVFLANMIFT